ncbi:MAG: 4Fe-4S binding protein [Oscillospiraceae bacterium]|nr:4Fe-4S binding protein [Oscillospiraceae bacterium]
MIRKIITIDTDKCDGCGLCAKACHEGAIGIVDGKAALLREDYCDGLGDCLPACPRDAISFEEREAAAYDHAAVLKAKKAASDTPSVPGRLANFPIQLKLAPINAPYFAGADLLIAADCTAYCYGDFHRDFIAGRVTLIGCPKLDSVDYSQKLTQIFTNNAIRSVTVVRMIVPCCGGLPFAVKNAIESSGKKIPLSIITIDPNGQIIS